jgi:hypothetical protein
MTTRSSNLGPLSSAGTRPDNNGPLTGQRKSNDLPMTDATRTANDTTNNDTTARTTNDGPMVTS